MQAVRRDIEERRKQIHAVILVHMQFIKQLTVIKPLVYCSAILMPHSFYESSALASHTMSSVEAAR